MDFEAFKKAFGIVDGSMIWASRLKKTGKELARAWTAVGKVRDESSRATLAIELQDLEERAAKATTKGTSRPRETIEALSGIRQDCAKLINRAEAAAKKPALDRTGATKEQLSKEVLDWRAAIQVQVDKADQIDLDPRDTLRELVQKFEDDYRRVDVESRDHRLGRVTVKAIETTATRLIVLDRDRRQTQARVRTLELQLLKPMEVIEENLQSGAYGTPPTGKLGVALGEYEQSRREWATMRDTAPPIYVEELLGYLNEAIDKVDDVVHEVAQTDKVPPSDDELRDIVESVDYDNLKKYTVLWKNVNLKVQLLSSMPKTKFGKPDRGLFLAANTARSKALRPIADYELALAATRQIADIIQSFEETNGTLQKKQPRPTVPSPKDVKDRYKAVERRIKAADAMLKPDICRLLGAIVDEYHQARDDGKQRYKFAMMGKPDLLAAIAQIERLEAAVTDLEKTGTQVANVRLREMEDNETSPKLLLAECERWAKLSPDFMRSLKPETIDAIMGSIGTKANQGNQRQVVRAAIVARYDLEDFTGDMTAKAGPKLYKLMGDVPESHVKDNSAFKHLVRNRKIDSSWYTEGRDEIVINMPRTWMLGPGMKLHNFRNWFKGNTDDQDSEVEEGFKVEAITGKEVFDLTMLHEIGHAVDQNHNFMTGKQGKDPYGGWKTETLASVAEALGEGKGFFTAFPTVDRVLLRAFLIKRLEGVAKPEETLGQKPARAKVPGHMLTDKDTLMGIETLQRAERDVARLKADDWQEESRAAVFNDYNMQLTLTMAPGGAADVAKSVLELMIPKNVGTSLALKPAVDKALAEPLTDQNAQSVAGPPAKDVTWKQLRNHPASKLADKLRESGDNGLWDKGRSGANAANIGGRVYQESYKGFWVSYTFKARGQGVSSYQFRSDAEWFAEVYGFYYMDRLPKKHPLYPWLKGQEPPTR